MPWVEDLLNFQRNAFLVKTLQAQVANRDAELALINKNQTGLAEQVLALQKQVAAIPPKSTPVPPVWLDQSKGDDVYEGYIQLIDGNVSLKDKRMIYAYSAFDLEQWQSLKGANDDETLRNIQIYVCKSIANWVRDKEDDWQFPAVTLSRKPGSDCEDTAILFVTIAHALGITDCFLGCGTWNGQGHAFPICKWNGAYYVFETVTHPDANNPCLFVGSTYSCEWGLSNPYFIGFLRPEFNKGINGLLQF